MKTYTLRFGFGDPRTYTGLAPTMLIFVDSSGATVAPPAISEALTGSGIYKFSYGTTVPISFLADAATTSPGPQGRYVVGQLDPSDRADEYGTTLVAIGTTSTAVGLTMVGIGLSNIALGTTSVAIGLSNIALGTTNVALGTTILASSTSLSVVVSGVGSTASSFGTSSADPVDLFGYMKRILENLEGNQTFLKPTGALSIYSRGSSVLLASKTVANSVTTVVKS